MAAFDAGRLPPAPPPAPSAPRNKATGRRFSRWHLDTTVPQEEDGWLITYLDVITLMLVMMVVMLSLSGPPATQTEPTSPVADTAANGQTTAETPPATPVPPPAPPAVAQGLPLQQLGQDVEVHEDANAVRFRLSTEFLFPAGSAEISRRGRPALDELIPLLNANPTLRLVVEGHTDSTPIRTARFPSNWELSTARAAAVARYLAEHGVAPQRVQASGFADTRPLGGKDNPVDRKANRRVDLVMEKAQAVPAPR